jgi:chromosomal replication initiator protein
MPRATFETWLKGTCVLAYEPGDEAQGKSGLLIIGTQNTYAKDWLENRLNGKIMQTVAGILGRPVDLQYRVRSYSKTNTDASEPLWHLPPSEVPAQPALRMEEPKMAEISTSEDPNGNSDTGVNLNPRYTFDNFIVGNGNRLAHAAAVAVTEHPSERYNPLFVYGGVGLGKTHLLHAAGHVPAARGLKVRVVSSEQFTNELITAIRTQTTEAFREKYRDLDVLLIDDIQFIAGKERIQEEFFHTFNTLHGVNKQIVLTSDRHPKNLTTLEERLRSRFEWGLTADIQPPDLETRIAILQSKAEQHRVSVPLAVLEMIARQIESNIRELEGALNRVVMFAQTVRCPITLDTASQALASLIAAKPEPPSVPIILEIVANHYGLSLEELHGRSRSRRVALPRQVAMYILREEANLSFPQIGGELGGRDHTTVMHAHEKIVNLIAQDDSIRRDIISIKETMYR